jgi:hypothetical protein
MDLMKKHLELVIKALGWRLEFLKEYPDLGNSKERRILERIIREAGFKAVADPESGEINLLRLS